METKNAKIIRTFLGFEDHGIFTFYLTLDYGGSIQSAGGYSMKGAKSNIILELLEVLKLNSWEELKEQMIRVKASHDKVYAIGHPLDDRWLDFDEFCLQVERINNENK